MQPERFICLMKSISHSIWGFCFCHSDVIVNEVDELACWLVLNRLPKMGPRRFAALLQQESSLLNCFDGAKPRHGLLKWAESQGLKIINLDWKSVEKDLKWREKAGCEILTSQDRRYPLALKEIPSKPPVLFVEGQIESLNKPQIALVGSRNPTSQGRDNAYQFSFELVKAGFAITSGLALGIDGASHEGALEAKGVTIAALGNSLDIVYPAKHHALASRIKEKGALVSEFPIGTGPHAANFPRRNRIISGLSLGVVVIESAVKSGSLITASYALEQGREIFALPGSIHNPMAKGCHHLIRQGAKCVESVAHILEELPCHHLKSYGITQDEESLPAKFQNILDNDEGTLGQSPLLSHIDNRVCTPIDLLIDKTGLTLAQVSSMLLELELNQKVTLVPGGYIRTVG